MLIYREEWFTVKDDSVVIIVVESVLIVGGMFLQ